MIIYHHGGILLPLTSFLSTSYLSLSLRLLEDDGEWEESLNEAATVTFGKQLCDLFVFICVHNAPSNPLALWEKFKCEFADDFARERKCERDDDVCINMALIDIHVALQRYGKKNE